jgi:hypothetical protein
MNQRLRRSLLAIPLFAATFVGCGGEGSESNTQGAVRASSITYRLTPTLVPSIDKNGSRIGVKVPPTGPTGLIEEVGLVGTLTVVGLTPSAADLMLDYQISRVALEGVDATGQVFPFAPQVLGQGEDIGHIQVRVDGTLAMRLRATVDSLEYELTGEAGPDRYSLAAGQLVLRGVTIQTPDGEPYFGTPTLTFFAAPES